MTRSIRPVSLASVTVLVLAALVSAACNRTGDALATVNGVPIPASQVDAQMAQVEKQATSLTVTAAQDVRARILESLIQAELIRQQGDKLGVGVTTEQIDAAYARLVAQYGGQAAFEKAMKQSGIAVARIRDSIRSRLLSEGIMAKAIPTSTVTVTDPQIGEYYTENKTGEFTTPAQVHAAHILISATDTVLAGKVLALARGGADFAQLAAKYSKDAGSAKTGGELGWAAPGNYAPPLAAAIGKMKAGSVASVKDAAGWHVLKLLGRRPAQTQALSAVSEQIRQTLAQEAQSTAFTGYLADLRRKADVRILDAELKKIIEAGASATASPAPTK